METVKFWRVETPFIVRYFESEEEADRFYNACERASISSFVRRNAEKIAEIRGKIAEQEAWERYKREERDNIDANIAEGTARMQGLVPIAEYARAHGIDPATVRQKCIRGGWSSAVKIGRDWFIDPDEPHRDRRRKGE